MSGRDRAPDAAAVIARDERVTLREIVRGDAAPYLRLVSDPDWVRYIGKSPIETVEAAADFIAGTLEPHYREHGFGLWALIDEANGAWAGICGALRRGWLEHPDLGFALLPEYRRRGLVRAGCELTIAWLREHRSFEKIQAVLVEENVPSLALLRSLGFREAGEVTVPGTDLTLLSMERAL